MQGRISVRALECRGISVQLGGVQALKDIDVTLQPGERVGLVGPNGAGKTTLLNVMTGFVRPSAGSVTVDGKDVTGWSPHRRSRLGLHRSFQGLHLFGPLSVQENVELAALAAGRSPRDARRRAVALIDELGLNSVRDEACSDISHGHAQRASMARALVEEPTYVVLDEPAAGLSDQESGALVDVVREAAERGTGVLLVEHDLNFVDQVCDRLYTLSEGLMIFEGTMQDAFANAQVQAAYLGPMSARPLPHHASTVSHG